MFKVVLQTVYFPCLSADRYVLFSSITSQYYLKTNITIAVRIIFRIESGISAFQPKSII